MKSVKPITIKEIAKELNVSVSTVSRALNDHSSIGLETRKKIQQFAQKNNYQKNFAAVHFKTGKSFTIGVIVPELSESFFSIAVTSIEDVAMENDYKVFFSQSHNSIQREKELLEYFNKNRVDGLLVSVSKNTLSIQHFIELQAAGVPVVFFDRVPSDINSYTVSCNLFDSSKIIINYLWEKGHIHIALIKGPSSLKATNERMRGFMEGLSKKKVKTDGSLFASTDLTKESTWSAMEEILSQENRPTAVVAFNDYVALDAIQYIKKNTQLQVNKDIFFVSYANLPFTQYIDILKPLASIEQFPAEQGKLATELLFRVIDGENIPVNKRHIEIEGKLITHFE